VEGAIDTLGTTDGRTLGFRDGAGDNIRFDGESEPLGASDGGVLGELVVVVGPNEIDGNKVLGTAVFVVGFRVGGPLGAADRRRSGDGRALGFLDGDEDGTRLGDAEFVVGDAEELGPSDGARLGEVLVDGSNEMFGALLGMTLSDGNADELGTADGPTSGCFDGADDNDGTLLGRRDGTEVGFRDGSFEAAPEGAMEFEGTCDGAREGRLVGVSVNVVGPGVSLTDDTVGSEDGRVDGEADFDGSDDGTRLGTKEGPLLSTS
jgi:hypothetical protein